MKIKSGLVPRYPVNRKSQRMWAKLLGTEGSRATTQNCSFTLGERLQLGDGKAKMKNTWALKFKPMIIKNFRGPRVEQQNNRDDN